MSQMIPIDLPSFPTSETVNQTIALQAKIQQEKDELEAPWLGKLPFCADTYGDCQYIDHDNIFVHMQNTAMSGCIIRFSPAMYHPCNSNLERLVRDICQSSRQNGIELISARGVRPPICKSLVCSCSIILQQKKSNQEAQEEAFRSESLHNDRKNNRPNGNRLLARRSATKRRLTRHDPMCTFRLNIYLDSTSFYLKIGSGCV
jgi:hypothetical protein